MAKNRNLTEARKAYLTKEVEEAILACVANGLSPLSAKAAVKKKHRKYNESYTSLDRRFVEEVLESKIAEMKQEKDKAKSKAGKNVDNTGVADAQNIAAEAVVVTGVDPSSAQTSTVDNIDDESDDNIPLLSVSTVKGTKKKSIDISLDVEKFAEDPVDGMKTIGNAAREAVPSLVREYFETMSRKNGNKKLAQWQLTAIAKAEKWAKM